MVKLVPSVCFFNHFVVLRARPKSSPLWHIISRIERTENGTAFMIGDVKVGNKTTSALYRVTATNWNDLSTYTFTNIRDNFKKLSGPFSMLHILHDSRLLVGGATGEMGISDDDGETYQYVAMEVTGDRPIWDFPNNNAPPYGRNSLTQDPKNNSRWILGAIIHTLVWVKFYV